MSLVRLFLWHLMQPAVYASVLFYYEPQIDRVQFHLGVAVLAREASYVLLILYALCTRPAFLLVNLDSNSESKDRLAEKIMYVLSPEKFLSYAAVPGRGEKCDGHSGRAVLLVMALKLANWLHLPVQEVHAVRVGGL